MRLVVADTGPINYLLLIGHIDLLPRLFERVVIPHAVFVELSDADAPSEVKAWVRLPLTWLDIYDDQDEKFKRARHLGEIEVIALATRLQADLILMDDRKAVLTAQKAGFQVIGTLGVLDLAAGRGMINFAEAITNLEATNFRRPIKLLEMLLEKHRTQS